MKIIDIVIVVIIAVLMLLFTQGYFQKKKSFRGAVLSKEEKAVPSASTISISRIVRFNSNEGIIELSVLNEKDYEKLKLGDSGLITHRGNIFFEFEKD